MCGLAGFVDLDRPRRDEACAALELMARAIERRGPDDFGYWYVPESGVGFAHRRLSIHDLSPAGHQPMISADGRWVLAFNGEIYNFKDVRAELEGHGVGLRGGSDTEVLLEGIAHWGVDATLPKLAGMFAFAAYDLQSRLLWLARDRTGEKPLYFGWLGRRLFFGSTVSSLEQHPRFSAEIDLAAVADLFRYRCIRAPLSIYRGIQKLEPGCRVKFQVGDAIAEPSHARYWRLPAATRETATGLDDLESTLRTVVSEQLVADRPLGAFLSGGIDSSVVVAMMAEVAAKPVKTFTIGFDDPAFDEAGHASRIAKRFGTQHEEVYLRPADALEFVPALADCYDEPFADSSQLPTLLVSRVAREHVVVALSGDGGDESFGGYDRYFSALAAWRRLARFPRPVRRLAAAGLRGAGRPGIDVWLPWVLERLRLRAKGRSAASALRHRAGVLETGSLLDLYSRKLEIWRDPSPAFADAGVLRDELRDEITELAEHAGFGPLRSMMALDFATYLPDDVLVKVDRASMFFGLETRSPLLDHRVVEAAWRMPEQALASGTLGKAPLRALLERRLPAEEFDRPKRGFGVPMADWLRGPLREWAEELLSDRRLRETGFLDTGHVRMKWQQHLDHVWDHSAQIWAVLMLLNWQRRGAAESATPLGERAPAVGTSAGGFSSIGG